MHDADEAKGVKELVGEDKVFIFRKHCWFVYGKCIEKKHLHILKEKLLVKFLCQGKDGNGVCQIGFTGSASFKEKLVKSNGR